jgi:teichoic acid D-alanine hydrolase
MSASERFKMWRRSRLQSVADKAILAKLISLGQMSHCLMKRLLLLPFVLVLLRLPAQPAALSEVFTRYAAQHDFNGVALVATDGRLDFIRAAGTADRAAGLPMRTDARFKIASVTKTFTAVLILQLFEEGKLRLDGTIGDYLPGYQGEGRDRVTIHHLLSHSSGLPNSEGETGIGVYQAATTLDSFVVAHCSGRLTTTPGTQFQYNNGDYVLLGKIVAQLRGKPFALGHAPYGHVAHTRRSARPGAHIQPGGGRDDLLRR